MIEEFIKEGYLLQLNANSLLGKHGQAEKAFGEELVKRNMIHLVGSDGHNNSFRKTDIKEALKRLEELNSELHGFILENEHKVLEGLDIDVPESREIREKKKGFFGLFKRK
ncbi:Tyrosine-protein phosphatase YwqE [compost metagenome]